MNEELVSGLVHGREVKENKATYQLLLHYTAQATRWILPHWLLYGTNYKLNHKIDIYKRLIVDTSTEHIKESQNKFLKLKIENAFLKELRRLRLEGEAKMREWCESPT